MAVNILLVEDDDDVRQILSHTLQFRYDVTEVNNARSALELLQNDGKIFEIAIIDLWMPGMDGLTLIETMRKDEELSKISVIIITGIVPDHDLPEAFWSKNLGVDAFLQKPFHSEELIKKCDEIIRKRKGLPPEDEQTFPRGGYL
jgi:CheY-like chemotaxis protein